MHFLIPNPPSFNYPAMPWGGKPHLTAVLKQISNLSCSCRIQFIWHITFQNNFFSPSTWVASFMYPFSVLLSNWHVFISLPLLPVASSRRFKAVFVFICPSRVYSNVLSPSYLVVWISDHRCYVWTPGLIGDQSIFRWSRMVQFYHTK